MRINIVLTKEEKKVAKMYAKQHGLSLSMAMKDAFFDQVENEYDIIAADKALQDFEKDPITYTHEEVKQMFDIN